MYKKFFSILLAMLLLFPTVTPVLARGEVLGIHILQIGELSKARELLENGDDKDKFVTVPLTLDDLSKPDQWQGFFDEAHRLKVRPLIRLTTRYSNGAWQVPTRADIIAYSAFLSSLEWHRPELTVILFNEPNHAKEWGGTIDPDGFAHVSYFASSWFATESKDYTILPAALDLAADGRNGTMEAFAYWKKVFANTPEYLTYFEGWNSHSYPNPAFRANPSKSGQNSLRGYTNELAFLNQYTQKILPVYITETGWDQNALSSGTLRSYFQKAFSDIWSKDERIVAVTPFVLQGAPGNFAPFSFLDASGKPTRAYLAYKELLYQN